MNLDSITTSKTKFSERELDILGRAYQSAWDKQLSFLPDSIEFGKRGYIVDELHYWNIRLIGDVSVDTANKVADMLFIADKLHLTWNESKEDMWRCLFYCIPYFEKRMQWAIRDIRREFQFKKYDFRRPSDSLEWWVKRIVTDAVERTYYSLLNEGAVADARSIDTEYGDYVEGLRVVK